MAIEGRVIEVGSLVEQATAVRDGIRVGRAVGRREALGHAIRVGGKIDEEPEAARELLW